MLAVLCGGLTVFVGGDHTERSVCVCEQEPTRLRDAPAVGHETISDLLAIGNEFRTHAQRVVHAGFAALLVVGGRLVREGRENETKQRQPKCRPKMQTRKARANSATYSGGAESAYVPATTKAVAMPSATAMRSQSVGESGGLT